MTYFPIILAFTFLLLHPNNVHAHVLKSDGSVGAVMHLTPEDDPIAGQPSEFVFELKDKQGKFTPENCHCTVTILESNRPIYNQPLFANNQDSSLRNASFSFTFPRKNIYTIQVTGQPLIPNTFNAFNLEYDIRVDKHVSSQTSPASAKSPLNSAYFPAISAGLLTIAFLGIMINKAKTKK